MNKSLFIPICLFAAIGVQSAHADEDLGDRVENRFDVRGDRIDNRLDVKGDRIDNRLDTRGDRIDTRLDRASEAAGRRGPSRKDPRQTSWNRPGTRSGLAPPR